MVLISYAGCALDRLRIAPGVRPESRGDSALSVASETQKAESLPSLCAHHQSLRREHALEPEYPFSRGSLLYDWLNELGRLW
jgi:hypothetical protein